MSEAVQLKQIEERLTDLLLEADRVAEDSSLPSDAEWKPAFQQFRTRAHQVHDKSRSPVKIGVVGEFSAGKTLLLGSLIGYADALPVKEIATTGNVTALRFIPVEGLATTEVNSYQIEFLTHAGFEECLDYMLEQALRRARSAELREDLRDKLAAIKGHDPQAPSKVEEWARAAWATTNPALKYSIRELVRFVRAYMRCGPGLCEGEPFTISAEHAARGLELDAQTDNIQTAAYGDIPTPSQVISTRPDSLSAEQIRAAFPLIRLVTIEVKLSAGIWDFSGLGADRFILMDFPGLGADSSGVRDLFLCLRELEQVQTLLILLNGRKPGGDQGIKIYNLLQENRPGQDVRDMVLVGVGRFDQLPLGAEGEAKLRELSGVGAAAGAGAAKKKRGSFSDEEDEDEAPPPKAAPAGPLTENALVQALPILGSAIAGAEALVPAGRSDRVVFLSPLLHLKTLEEKNVGLRVGSDEFMGNARLDVEKGMALRPLWRGVAERLQPSVGSRSRPLLAQWLGDFAEDGGIARLRALIQSHVQGAGFAQLLRDVQREKEALKEAQREFRDALPPAAGSGPDVRTPADKIAAAEKHLRDLMDYYQKQSNRLKISPRLTLTSDSLGRPLEDYLHEEVVFRLDDWSVWDTLLQHSKDGYIREKIASSSKPRKMFGEEDEEDEEEQTAFPTRSEDFFPPFEQTVQQLRDFTLGLIDRGVAEYLARLVPDVEAARLTLAAPLERRSLPKEIRALRLGERGKELVGALRVAVSPTKLRTGLFRTDEAPEDGPEESAADLPLTATKAENLFPLARSTKDSPGRVFAWAARFQEGSRDARPEAHLGHQAMVLRLRDAMVRMLCQEMSQLLSEGTQHVLDRLSEKIDTMVAKLGVASSNRFVLETILTEPAEAGEAVATVDSLQPFRRLASANLT